MVLTLLLKLQEKSLDPGRRVVVVKLLHSLRNACIATWGTTVLHIILNQSYVPLGFLIAMIFHIYRYKIWHFKNL